jgi:hypothetical protein
LTNEQIATLMADVGPVLEPLAIHASDEDAGWAILMDEDLIVAVDIDEQKRSLVLSSELGEPPSGDRSALYETLLQMNYHWNVTGGTRMGIDGPAGKVVQVFETPADALNAVNLSEIISAFADTARTWREIVQRSSQTATPERGGYPGIKV